MKKALRIYRWIVISVLLQVSVLSYLNFIYLPNRGNVKTTMYDMSEDKIKSKSLRLPSGAEDIKVSFNGLFAAYMNDGSLTIKDIRSGKDVRTLGSSGGGFGFFRWLPDRAMLIYSEDSPGGKKGQVRISTYDISTGLVRSYPSIKGLPEGSEVVEIELSPLTNVVYSMVKTGSSSAQIYKYDIMDNLKYVMTTGTGTVMEETTYSDYLVYQKADGKIYCKNGRTGSSKSLAPEEGSILLAVDSKDRIYAGAPGSGGKVDAIYSGTPDQDVKSWKKTELGFSVLPSDIAVTPEGAIYVVDRGNLSVRSLDGGSEIKYSGKLLDVLDDYIVSTDGNRLELTALSKL